MPPRCSPVIYAAALFNTALRQPWRTLCAALWLALCDLSYRAGGRLLDGRPTRQAAVVLV